MDLTTFLISVFCLVDDFLKDKRLRQRGPQPTLSDTEAAEELLQGVQGWALDDRNYWKPDWQLALKEQGLALMAPYKSAKRQKFRYSHWLVEKRYRIETVFGQLVDRFHAKKVWARDAWHLISRWWRKLLSHLVAVLFCQQLGLSPLRFSELLTD